MLCEHKKCTGCMACVQICAKNAVKMQKESDGFWYPTVNVEKCVNCGACTRVCPMENEISVFEDEPEVYAVWNKNETVRESSSSGGVFRALGEWIVKNDGTVYGAAWNERFEAVHCRKDKAESLKDLSGSKYVQSYIGSCYTEAKKDLLDGKWVLFSGTPCQIAGLRGYLGREYEKLVTCELVCHGVPSPGVFADYLKGMEESHASNVCGMTFRNKARKRAQNIKINFENGTEYKTDDPMKDWYYRAFQAGVILRENCYDCHFIGVKRRADITLGDFWGLADSERKMEYPSLLWINSAKGRAVWEKVKDYFYVIQRPKEEAVAGNLHFRRSTPCHAKREIFFDKYKEKGISEQTLQTIDTLDTWKEKVKRLVGPEITAKIIKLLKR